MIWYIVSLSQYLQSQLNLFWKLYSVKFGVTHYITLVDHKQGQLDLSPLSLSPLDKRHVVSLITVTGQAANIRTSSDACCASCVVYICSQLEKSLNIKIIQIKTSQTMSAFPYVGLDEIKNDKIGTLKALFAEFIGTGILVKL